MIWAMVVLSCGLPGCRGAGTASQAASRAEVPGPGLFSPWRSYRSVRSAGPTADTQRRWVAVAEPKGRLRVWSLGEDAALRDLLLDTGDSFTLRNLAWCGDLLLYTGWEGRVDLHDLDMFPPPEGMTAYLAERSRSLAWHPLTHSTGDGVPGGFWVALADPPGKRLVVFDRLSQIELREREGDNFARIFSMPGFELKQELELRLGDKTHPEIGSSGWLLGWHPVEDGFYAVSKCLSPLAPHDPMEIPFPLLLFIDSSGNVRRLSGNKDPRLAQTHRHGIRAISLIEDGTAVAGKVEHWQGGSGIAVYDLDGLRREYPFGVYRPFPPKLMEVAPWWQFIICTPDGRRALYQELPYYTPHADREMRRWVYLWDLEKETYEPVVHMKEIEECYGWLSDTALLVGARAEVLPAPIEEADHRDYGVLHLLRPEHDTPPAGE